MAPENQPGTPTSYPRVVKTHGIPPDDEIPPACQSQRIINMKTTIFKSRYALATHVIAEIDILSHYEANVLIDPIAGVSEEYLALLCVPNSKLWGKEFVNNLVRLSQGVGTRMPTGNNTIFFINKNVVPKHNKVTYVWVVADIRLHKEETHHVLLTMGGYCLDFDGVTATQCASLFITKIVLNSTISKPGV